MRKPKAGATKPCPIPHCWIRIPLHKALCPACTSWWFRVSIKTPEELAIYMRKMARIAGRGERLVSGVLARHHKRAA